MNSIGNLPAPASDLRSEAKDYQRDRNRNAKWAKGSRTATGKRCPHSITLNYSNEACSECVAEGAIRPFQPDSSNYTRAKHMWNSKVNHKTTMARKIYRSQVVEATGGTLAGLSDSSGEEEIKDASAAPVPDADVMYSFDAVRGPGQGSDLLGYAISQAVERFENKETEKIAKEYEFVDGKDNGYAADADEDDFELIDHSHLN